MPYMIENRMVVDSQWPEAPSEIKEKLNSAGYKEMSTGIFVTEEDAYQYALERISQNEELKQELVEWFCSGNWIKED